MKLHFLGVAWCVGVAAGWVTLPPLHKGVEDLVDPTTPANDSAFLDSDATTDLPSPTDGINLALTPSSPPSNAPTPVNPSAPTSAHPPAFNTEQPDPITDINTSFIPNTSSTSTTAANISSTSTPPTNITSTFPNPVPETNAHPIPGHVTTLFPTPVHAPHTNKTPNQNKGSVPASTTSSSSIPAAQNTTEEPTHDSANTPNSTDLTNETQKETATDSAATISTPPSTKKLWRGMKCELMQWKNSPDCVVAIPSQVFYPWDVFRTTYEVIMAELTTRYTALPLNTPELDGVKVYCKGMEELKLTLRWCYLLVPSARAIVPMPQASVSFHLDKGRYEFAEKWMYKAVEVRCPSTPPFWIRRFDPIRCASVNHTCLDDTYDYLDELDKTAIPEAINVPPSW